ncbi:MAG: hypothetical protein ACKVQR_23415 [Aquabacterium sp.]
MAEKPEGESFLRKVVRFVANPATDWSDLSTRHDDGREFELEKSELKAMIERKRRNDFVRKREFDMLRKLRRDGLSPEQLAALGGSSRIDDSEAKSPDSRSAKPEGVKAKIDEIEQQMVGEGGFSPSRNRPPEFYAAPTEPLPFRPTPEPSPPPAPAVLAPGLLDDPDRLPALPPLPDDDAPLRSLQTQPGSKASMGPGISPLSPAPAPRATPAPARPAPSQTPGPALEVSEVVHDPELDEAVIAFANADFNHCENALTQLVKAGAPRHAHPETWLVLLDLHRATGQQARFEALALDYVNLFGRSAPQWVSMPKVVAEAAAQAADERPMAARVAGDVGWISPSVLDVDAVARLRSATLQMPLPWVFEWSAVRRVEAEAASNLAALFRDWAGQRLEMRWLSGEQLLATLAEAAPTGVRDADPAFWMARLETLRLANRPDQFDETAIDYCVTYEVSPPSWERSACTVRISGGGPTTAAPAGISELHTGFMESGLLDDPQAGGQVAKVDLSGQLVGDIGLTLSKVDTRLGPATMITVSCARLIRVDFIAAGDLLNWVLARRNENRSVTFTDAHRLVALFFGAMGINEHARVQVARD